MNELQVTVEQNPGAVKWNFEELKNALEAEMKVYEKAVYDDGMIKTAKNDIASLRKLRDSVEKRRKEIRRKCLEPYDIIEIQAKELTGLIDRPIVLIDKRIKEYEEDQKKIRRAEIIAFFDHIFVDVDPEIAGITKEKKYDIRWENASASKKSWQDAIHSIHDTVKSDLALIGDVDEDCREAAMKVYKTNLAISDALMKANEMKRQKEALLEAERRRREEAEKRKQEEEHRRLEAEEKEKQEANTPAQSESAATEPSKAVPVPCMPAAPVDVWGREKEKPSVPIVKADLVITGTEEQINKIKGYIKYIGASFVERSLWS